ncbi:MAG TPA: FtsX-like permease family protein [Polyangiaceae bacterium]|nr:FtsX-like permease family protein [Polyangiaceae bacterium]
MRLSALGVRNVLRNRARTVLTILGVAVAIVAFMALRTVLTSWTEAVNHAAKDRIATRHKITFVMTLPKRYVDDVRSTPGVVKATFSNWFGGQNPKNENEFFATIAVEPQSFLEVFDEIQVPADQRESWLQNRRGAVVGDVLAKKFGWKVGDRVTLKGTIYPGNWEFDISGIYTATRRSVDRSTFWFHWDYLNESVDARSKDQIGWIAARIDKPEAAAQIAKRIDTHFDEKDIQTLSMSERALNTSFLGMFTTVLKAMDVVSIVILLIMMLILGNTIAMGVRERTNEYGVLRAIGFLPKHIALFVVGEAITIGALGGLVGILLSYPLVENGIGRWLEENMGGFFPYFRIADGTTVAAALLSLGLGALAAAIPAYRASKLDVIDALRRIG